MRTLRLDMEQINLTVGDLRGNTQKIIQYIHDARKMGVDLIITRRALGKDRRLPITNKYRNY